MPKKIFACGGLSLKNLKHPKNFRLRRFSLSLLKNTLYFFSPAALSPSLLKNTPLFFRLRRFSDLRPTQNSIKKFRLRQPAKSRGFLASPTEKHWENKNDPLKNRKILPKKTPFFFQKHSYFCSQTYNSHFPDSENC